MKKNQGFTLVELLVVISIIGVLAGLALVSFVKPQKQTRDTQRKSDLKQYQTALETFANANAGLYPSFTTTADASEALCTPLEMKCPGPEDPREEKDPVFSYHYQSNGSGAGSKTAAIYVLWARLEAKDEYWILCSSGRAGAIDQSAWAEPVEGGCPL